MNKLTATKTAPVIQNVRLIVSSIVPQLEAIGVKYHGLRGGKRTEPTTNNITTIAIAISGFNSQLQLYWRNKKQAAVASMLPGLPSQRSARVKHYTKLTAG